PRSVAANETTLPVVAFEIVGIVSGGRSSTKTSHVCEGSTPPRTSVASQVIRCGPPESVNVCPCGIEVHGPESTRYQIIGGPLPVRSIERKESPVSGRI